MQGLEPDEILKRIGAKIAEIRREKGLTQKQFGALLGKEPRSTQWVSRIERGGQNMTVHTLAAIANALGVGFDELCCSEPKTRVSRPGRPRVKKS